MTKLKEVIHKHNLDANSGYKDGRIESAMKEFATWYAKKCLEIAAEAAFIAEEIPEEERNLEWEESPVYHSGGYIRNEHYVSVSKESILNIKLPEHDYSTIT